MGKIMEEVKSTIVPSMQVAVWWIGQSGYIFKTHNNKVLFIDAFLSRGSFGMVPPPLEPEEIECDLYLCTHNHGDHADLKSIARITKKDDVTFVGPKNVVKSLLELGIRREKICEVNVGDFVELEGVKIRGALAIPTDESVLDAEGFLLETSDGITIYHTGDSGFHHILFYLSHYRIDLMMVCINGGMGNMNIEEAVQLTRLLRPRIVIPNHYGMFAGNTDDPVRFSVRLTGSGAEAPCLILKVGEKYTYDASALVLRHFEQMGLSVQRSISEISAEK